MTQHRVITRSPEAEAVGPDLAHEARDNGPYPREDPGCPRGSSRRSALKRTGISCALAVVFLTAAQAGATPSTTTWAPSTTSIQPFMTPHITYDTYFGRKLPASGTSPVYPIDTGLTMGVLPLDAINLEVGFDLMLPSNDPLLFNAKLGIPESTLGGIVSIAAGIYNVGTNKGVTDYNIVYGQIQKNLPWGGYLSVGGYYGLGTEKLFDGSDGKAHRAGFIGGVASPDIVVDKAWLKKIVLAADVQTGKNVFGAVGVSPSFYFTDSIALLTGPIFFLDKASQPNASNMMWTVQLDVDLSLLPAPAPAAAPAEAPKT